MERPSKSGPWAEWPALAELRDSRKISVSQIAALTNIRSDYLTAIEQGDFEKLPGGVYTTSYIRQYARVIDYSEQDLLDLFNARMAASDPARIDCEVESPRSSGPRFLRWLTNIVS